jgi:hypothetical protein
MRPSTKALAPKDKPHWLIQGFDGLSRLGEWRIESGHISAENVQILLRVLAGRAGLTLDEIVNAHLNGRARGSNGLLDVKRDGPRLRFTCGENPHFVAAYRRGKGRTSA